MWRATSRSTGNAAEGLLSPPEPETVHLAWAIAAALGAALAVPFIIVASLATYLIVVASVLALPLLFLAGAVAVNARRLFAATPAMPSEAPLAVLQPMDVEQVPALVTMRSVGDSTVRAAATIIGADGECPRGLKMGQVIVIDRGRASVPLCVPAVSAVRSALQRFETNAALTETEAACDCPLPGRSVRFSIQRIDGAERKQPVPTRRAA